MAVTGSSPKSGAPVAPGTPRPALYIAQGFQTVSLSAPTSGIYENVAVVGPLSTSVTSGVTLDMGGAATIGGALYFPNGPMVLNNGAHIAAGQCLEIVVTQITMGAGGGGTSFPASPCFSAASGQGAPLLVE